MKTKTKQIGIVGVDSGTIWIGDPCYLLDGKKPKNLGKNWDEFVNKLIKKGGNYQQWNHDLGHPGLGVSTSTFSGDGEYPVFAKLDSQGRIMKVWVEFTQEDEKAEADELTVRIEKKDFPVKREVFNLIHSISLERDELKQQLENAK